MTRLTYNDYITRLHLISIMKNQEYADKELQRLQDIGKLKWNPKIQRWNKNFYPKTDGENNFIKWKFGDWPRKTCKHCGKILETVKENPEKRQSKFCSINHAKKHSTIVSRAKKKFDLHSSKSDNRQLQELILKLEKLKSKKPGMKSFFRTKTKI